MTALIGTICFVAGWFLAKTHTAAGKPPTPPSPAEPTSGGGPGPDEPKP